MVRIFLLYLCTLTLEFILVFERSYQKAPIYNICHQFFHSINTKVSGKKSNNTNLKKTSPSYTKKWQVMVHSTTIFISKEKNISWVFGMLVVNIEVFSMFISYWYCYIYYVYATIYKVVWEWLTFSQSVSKRCVKYNMLHQYDIGMQIVNIYGMMWFW